MAPKKDPSLASAFKGRWRIEAMDLWDRAAIDLIEPGFVSFNGEEGEMRFIAVHAWLDVRYDTRNKVPVAEFSWEGVDEGDQRSGRGWAVKDRNATQSSPCADRRILQIRLDFPGIESVHTEGPPTASLNPGAACSPSRWGLWQCGGEVAPYTAMRVQIMTKNSKTTRGAAGKGAARKADLYAAKRRSRKPAPAITAASADAEAAATGA